MNLRRKKPSDSLYMLLDTMCNAFGGIILLAVMVVLLTNKEKSRPAGGAGSEELLRRQLAFAETNLQASLQLESAWQAKAGDSRWKEQMALLTTRQNLEEEVQRARENIAQTATDLETADAADPAARLRFLNAQFSSAQAKELAAQEGLNAEEDNVRRLKQRLAGLEQEVIAKLQDMQRPLRLPLEHTSDKPVVYMIVKYGRVYPCSNPDLSQDTEDIHWTPLGFAAVKADPIPGKGLAPNATGDYFRRLATNSVYVAFVVYDDSFGAFIVAKQIAVASGLSYGWEPWTEADGPAAFGPGGHTPGAQ